MKFVAIATHSTLDNKKFLTQKVESKDSTKDTERKTNRCHKEKRFRKDPQNGWGSFLIKKYLLFKIHILKKEKQFMPEESMKECYIIKGGNE